MLHQPLQFQFQLDVKFLFGATKIQNFHGEVVKFKYQNLIYSRQSYLIKTLLRYFIVFVYSK